MARQSRRGRDRIEVLERSASDARRLCQSEGLSLSQNSGENAMFAGPDMGTGRAVIPVDADLQDPSERIRDMVRLCVLNGLKVFQVAARTEPEAADNNEAVA